MIEVITAAGFALAWLAFRYDRHVRWRTAVDGAHGTLTAVHRGMISGVIPGDASAWGKHYFHTIYTDDVAGDRARNTRELVMRRMIDQVLVVPTEPLAMLATVAPHPGLIEPTTVAVANTALWRVGVFNQLVQQLTDFNSVHAVEITSDKTDWKRREEVAAAAMTLSYLLHRDGIGEAAAEHSDGSMGWYRAFVGGLNQNLKSLEDLQKHARWRWLREWPYSLLDMFALVGFVVVTATVVTQHLSDDGRSAPPPAATKTVTTTARTTTSGSSSRASERRGRRGRRPATRAHRPLTTSQPRGGNPAAAPFVLEPMEKPVGILYEHPQWFLPLFAELERRGIPFERIHAGSLLFDPSELEQRYSLVVNRMSPSAWTRGHERALFATLHYLAYLEQTGTPVLNGHDAYLVELSKVRQLSLLASLGIEHPRTRVIDDPRLAADAARELEFPVVVKPNIGGSGAGIVSYASLEEIAAAEVVLGVDGTALVQEQLPAEGDSIVRIEILDGRFLYAIRFLLLPDSFNLCPADYCELPGIADGVSGRGLPVESYEPPAEVVDDAIRILAAAGMDLGGVEYLVNARTGKPTFYDVNALSNFVANAPDVIGFDPFVDLVDLIAARAGLLEPVR